MEKLGERLQDVRKKNGYSQEQLADLLNVSRQAISKWERNEASPDTENLIALAKLYNISVDELLFGKQENSNLEKNEDFNHKKTQDNVKSEFLDNEIDDEEDEDDDADQKLSKRQRIIVDIVSGITLMIALIVYLSIGFCFKIWHPSWIVFLSLPIVVSLVEAIFAKKGEHFAFPVLIVAIYLILGFQLKLWHPAWFIFLTIPVYYIVFKLIKLKRK